MSNVEAKVSSNLIPVGYKQTEVGVIPEDWDIYCFSDCGYFQSGSGFPTKYQGEQEGDYPFFKVSDMNNIGNENILRSSNNYISENIRNLIAAKIIPVNAIIFAKIGAAIFLERKKICFQPSCIDNNLMAYIVNNDKLYYKYAYLLFKNIKLGHLVETTALPSLSSRDLGQKKIAFPTMEEQNAIANALSDVDALITELEKLITKKQAIKIATMQQLLTGRTRLPQFALREDGSQKGTKQSELGEIPEDWEVVYFDQLKDQKDNWAITGGPFGSNLKASDYTENGIRVIQLQNIGDGVFKNDDFVYTSKIKANELISCNIYPDEIILSKMGDPVARACLIPHIHDRYVMCSDGIRLKVNNLKYTEKFVFYFLNYPLFRKQALDASTGSTRKRIGLSELRELLLFAPSKKEQTAIATILSDMDEEIQALEQRLNKTGQIKQGMMQELLTGRTRLV